MSGKNSNAAKYVYEFSDVRFDVPSWQLFVGGEPVTIQRRPAAVLLHFLTRPRTLVTKEELFADVWEDRQYVDSVVASAIAKLRVALGDNAKQIVHLHGQGWRLQADVQRYSSGTATIRRAIEFPPEYFQAGLSILSYFGTVLRNRYTSKDVRFSIEQHGLTVVLVIRGPKRQEERLEKTLTDYADAVIGARRLEEIVDTPEQLIELRSQLRLAIAQIEHQRDIIGYRNCEVERLSSFLSHALSGRPPILQSISISTEVTNKHEFLMTSDRKRLVEELRSVAESLRSETEPAAKSAADDMDKAAGEIEAGKWESAAKWLGQGSRWALKTAGSIGAKIAEAALKAHLGL